MPRIYTDTTIPQSVAPADCLSGADIPTRRVERGQRGRRADRRHGIVGAGKNHVEDVNTAAPHAGGLRDVAPSRTQLPLTRTSVASSRTAKASTHATLNTQPLTVRVSEKNQSAPPEPGTEPRRMPARTSEARRNGRTGSGSRVPRWSRVSISCSTPSSPWAIATSRVAPS